MSYDNGKMQAKRIMRKLGEASFDLEMLRDWIFDMDYSSLDEWQEMSETLVDLRAEVQGACDLADAAIAALKADPPQPPGPSEQVANPFAPKHPQAATQEKNNPKDKAKGG